jgi:CRP/FNR family cyclic AMP-dependent transcriptional regulator
VQKTLHHVHIFSTLSLDEQNEIAQMCKWRTFEKDQYIVDKNDEETEIYFLINGSVRALNYSIQGKEVSYADINSGDCFGELSAIDGKNRSAAIVANTNTDVAILTSEQLYQIMEKHPSVAIALLKKIAGFLRFASSRIFTMSTQQAYSRVAIEIIQSVNKQHGDDFKNGIIISPAPKQLELATRIGTSRETVARAFAKMTDDKIIKRVTGGIKIINVEALKKIAENIN